MIRYTSYRVRHVAEFTDGVISGFLAGDQHLPDFQREFWTIYGFSAETREEAIGDFKTEGDALQVLYRITGIEGTPGTEEYPVQDLVGNALLKAAANTQTAFWNACRDLEQHLGFEIDSSRDLNDATLASLIECAGAPV